MRTRIISFVFVAMMSFFGVGCTYNYYGEDGGGGGDAFAVDAVGSDTAVTDTMVVDTAVADTTVADTTVTDTSVADTSIVEDTSVADTAVVEDTTVAEEDTNVAQDVIFGKDTVAQDTNVADTTVNCDDGDPCTTDTTVDGSCVHAPNQFCVECDSDAECVDFSFCYGEGTVEPTGVCLSAGTCEMQVVSCDDGNLCTDDSCDAGECVNDFIICDDQDHRTIEWCSPLDGQCHFQEWQVELWIFVPNEFISGTTVHLYPHGGEVVLEDDGVPFLAWLTYSQVCQGNTEVGIETQDLGWWGCDYDAPSKSEVTVWIGGEELDSNLQFLKHDWVCDWREDHGEGNLVFTPADFGCPTPE